MERISVVGSSGSGKTTIARAVASSLGVAHLELDSVYHQADWTPLPDDEFLAATEAFTAGEKWVVDGNYNSQGVLDLVWSKADTVVWVDPPKRVVMSRVVRRTVRRVVTREELWNGNRESLNNFTKWDPDENVIRWAWTTFDRNRTKYESRAANPRWSHLIVHRLGSRAEANTFLSTLKT